MQFVVLADRVADLAALRLGEGEGHAAAEDQVVDLVHQVLDDADLGRYLRTAHDGREGTFDVAQDVVDGLHLLLHEVAQHLVAGVEVVGDHGRRGVLAVRRSEGVVDIAVGVRSQRLGELLLRSLHRLLGLLVGGILLLDAHGLALLFGVEAEVFEHQRLARFERRSGLGSLGAVGSELDGHAQFFAHGVDDLAQRELGVDLAFGLAHVRHDDEAAAVGEHLFQRGKRPADAGVVGDFTVFIQRHVEVHADDRAFALEIVRIDCCHNALNFKVYLNALNPILLSNSGFEPAPEPPAARCGGIRRRSPSSSGGSGRVPQMYAFIFRNTHSSVCKITLRRDFLPCRGGASGPASAVRLSARLGRVAAELLYLQIDTCVGGILRASAGQRLRPRGAEASQYCKVNRSF